MRRTRTPRRASQRARTRPVGPAPTTRTSVSRFGDSVIKRGSLAFSSFYLGPFYRNLRIGGRGCNICFGRFGKNPARGTAMTNSAAGSGGSTEEVLARHWRDFQAGDVESILKDYAPDAMVITAQATRKGVAQIRAAFETLFAEIMPAKTSTAKLGKEVVEGEVAFILWSGSSDKYKIPFATDTFLVRGGKIVRQTFAAVMEKK